jgi:SPP1 gp7 family putative phage head morphogenesis protein
MADTSPTLINIDVRNQVLLERLKEGEHKKFTPFLKRIEKDVRKRLSDEGKTITSKKKLNTLLADVTSLQKAVYDDYNKQLALDLGEIGFQQSTFEAKSYEKVVAGYQSAIPSAEQALVAIRVNPMQMQDFSGKQLLEPFIKDWSVKETQRVNNAITQGFFQGQTNAEITRRIRGTKANNFNDGELAKVNRSNRTIVRTAVQHSSTQARQLTMRQNSDLVKQYQWVSTLDSKTSDQCTALDGRRFNIGEGPLPPIHPNCRSTTTPVLSEEFDFLDKGATRASKGDKGGAQVSTNETYFSWLKKQPVAFQADAIGPTRAKLLRNGGLTSDEFARLSLNRNFEAMTLKEMQKKAPNVFETANVKI